MVNEDAVEEKDRRLTLETPVLPSEIELDRYRPIALRATGEERVEPPMNGNLIYNS